MVFSHFGLAKVLQAQGKEEEAIHHLLQTRAGEGEKRPRFLYELADGYARIGDRDKAVRYARQARGEAVSRGQLSLVKDSERLLRQLGKSF